MSVQAVDESLDRGLVEVTQVTCALTGLLAHHKVLRIDQAESINDDLSLDGLNGIDDDSDGSRVKLLERLLSVDINGRQPAAETRMRVIPSDN